MKKALTYISLVLLLVIQTSAGHYIEIFGVVPNITLTFVILYSLTNSLTKAAVMGLVGGLLFDSCRVGAFGLNGLLLMYTSLMASYFSSKFYYESKTVTVAGVFIYTILYKTMFLILTSVLFSQTPFLYTFFRYILVEALWNAIIALPMLIWVKSLNNEYIRGI